MPTVVETLCRESSEDMQGTCVADVLREERLIRYRRQLEQIGVLETCLKELAGDLAHLCRNSAATLKQVKPLQEKARMVTSLIRGAIYLTEMRDGLEDAALTALEAKTGDILRPAPSDAEIKEKKSANTSVERSDAQGNPQNGASTARVKKNLATRTKPSKPDTTTPTEAVEKELATAHRLATTARETLTKKNLLATTAAPG